MERFIEMNKQELEQEIYKKQQIILYLKEEKQRIKDYIGLFEVAEAIDNVSKEVKEIPIIKSRLGFIMRDD